MRERPRLTVRRGRGEAPYLRELASGIGEPKARRSWSNDGRSSNETIPAMNNSRNGNIFSLSPERPRGGRSQSYWERITALAKEAVRGVLHFPDGVPEARVTEGTAAASSIPMQYSPPVLAAEPGDTSMVIEPSFQSRRQAEGIFSFPQRQNTPHVTNVSGTPDLQPHLPSAPQVVYNFYYMNGGSSLPGSVMPSGLPLQPDFIVNSSSTWNKASMLARRSVSRKRERERQETPSAIEDKGHTVLRPSSTDPLSINDSSHTFPASNVSYRASSNTSYSVEIGSRRLNSDVYTRQDATNNNYNIGGETESSQVKRQSMDYKAPITIPAPSNPFVRSGPPVVLPEEDGFAPYDGSDDDDKKTASAPSKPFSLGKNSMDLKNTAQSSAAPAGKPAAPPNPFSFGAGGNASGAAPAGKPAAPPNPFSFGAGNGSAFSKSAFGGVGANRFFAN